MFEDLPPAYNWLLPWVHLPAELWKIYGKHVSMGKQQRLLAHSEFDRLGNPCASTCLLSICRQTCSWVSQTYKNKWGPFLLYTEAVLNNLRSTIFIYTPRSDTFFCALQFYSLLIHLDLIWTYLISNLRKTAKEQIDYDLLQLWVKNQYYSEEKKKGQASL